MTQLIQVDFKARKVVSRTDLNNPEPTWSATSDPHFKEFVGGIAMMAESTKEEGGDWGQMIVVMHSTNAEGTKDYSVMYDCNLVPDDLAQEILRGAAGQVELLTGETNEPA